MSRKIIIIAIAFAVILPVQAFAAADYYLKLDGVEGESTSSAPARTRTVAEPEDAQEDDGEAELELEAEADDDGEEAEGKVEMEWKVEEGESAASDEEDVDADSDDQPLMPDFSILLGGGRDDDEDAQEARAQVSDILLQGMQEEDIPTESVSLNFDKVTTRIRQGLKLFGLIPVSALATVEVDAEERVTVKFPWWAFLASGKDDSLGERVFTALSNVLKTKHDTVKNAINNVR